MKYRPDEAALINYLYGESSPEEKEKIERFLEENPDEKQQLEELRSVREVMQKLPDREVIEPVVMLSGSSSARNTWMKTIMGIAASLIILVIAAFLLDFRIGFRDNTLVFGTGDLTTSSSDQEVLLTARQDALEQKIERLSQQLDNQLVSMEENKAKQPAYDQEMLEKMFAQYQQQNFAAFSELVNASEAEQKQFIQDLFVAFGEHFEDQRQQDLELINAGFRSLKSETDQRHMETETLLTNIMYDYNTQNN